MGLLLLALLLPIPAAPVSAAPVPTAVAGVSLSLAASGIGFSSSYVVTGEVVGVNATVANDGDTPANATLQLYAADPASSAPFAQVPFSVGASASVVVSAGLNTSALAGIGWVTARLVSIAPAENGSAADNQASARLRVHTLADQRWQGSAAASINTTYPQTGFITIEDTASLTIGPSGALSIVQGRPDEFDILVQGNGRLRLAGGSITSNYALTVELRDNATLSVESGALLAVSALASTAGAITFTGGAFQAPSLEVGAGSVSLDGASITADRAGFSGTALACANSTVATTSTIELTSGASAEFNLCDVTVVSQFATAGAAEGAYPGISGYLSAGAAPFQPALWLTGASTAALRLTTVASSIWVGGVAVASTVPVLATAGADATVYRTARVMVTDPIGAPVQNATVEVWDYFDTGLVTSTIAGNGTALIELPSDMLQGGRSNFVGHYHILARKAATGAPAAALVFPLFPDLSRASLTREVPIALALYAPWGLYSEDAPPMVVDTDRTITGDFVAASNVEVRAALLLDGANFTLLQGRPFERYVVVTDGGSLDAVQSTVHSGFPFNLYVINGTSARLAQSGLLGGNLLLSGAGNLTLDGSRVVGSAIGDAANIGCRGSFLWGRLIQVSAPVVTAVDCVAAASDLVSLAGGSVSLQSVGLTATFEPSDARNRTSLPFFEFDAMAGSDAASATSAPSVRIAADSLSASSVTVWTCGPFTLALGAGDSSIDRARLLVCAASTELAGGNLTLTDVAIDPSATVAYSGSGGAALRGVASPAPSVAAGVRLETYAEVTAVVSDAVGLPASDAQVTAVPQRSGLPSEAGLSGGDGKARLFLLASVTENGAATAGPTYRMNATRSGATSPTLSWDSAQPPEIAFTLPATFAAISPDANFVLAVPLPSGAWRILASSLENASVRPFLLSLAPTVPTLDFASAVYPGQNATLYVAADYVYTAGGERASGPMAGEPAVFDLDGVGAASFQLDADGAATVAVPLLGGAGARAVNLTISASKLLGPARYAGAIALTPLLELVVEASLNKRTLKPSEFLTIVGTVRDKTGAPVPGATITLTFAPGQPPRTNQTAFDGSFLIKVIAPQNTGSFAVTVTASRANAIDAPDAVLPYTVSTEAVTNPTHPTGGAVNLLAVLLGGAVFVGSAAGLVFAYTQRRIARGEFVVCGKCGKPTLAADKQCRNCGVEFEATVAKCSKCGAWIAPDSAQCPQCHTQFVTKVVREEKAEGPEIPPPSAGVPAGFDIPEAVPLTGRKLGPARLEDMEFRLPGTTDTLDLGEKAASEAFAASMAPAPAPRSAQPAPPADTKLERMELPRVQDLGSPVREVSAMEGGEPTAKEPVTLGSGNIDLSRTTAAATSTKPDKPADDQIPEDVLRELLMKAAPELTGDMLPGDIRKELQEIARSEAPAVAERRTSSGPRAERPAAQLPPDERTAEAPEKSRRTAFDVFSTPTKNIPAGYEKKGSGAPKDAAAKSAPVCPNCGGNWVVQRDGKNSCRVCGTRW